RREPGWPGITGISCMCINNISGDPSECRVAIYGDLFFTSAPNPNYVIYFKNNCAKNAQRLYFLRISSTIFEPGAL
ncbi:hypothetical protein, partial [Pantoea agglomerans]